MVGAPVRQCCEADCWVVAQPCTLADSNNWSTESNEGCMPYFACCYVDEVTSGGAVYFNYKGSCFKLDGTEAEVSTRPNGCELSHINDGDGDSYDSCAECIAANDEWYNFEECDCETIVDCRNVYIPKKFMDDAVGGCSTDCFTAEPCRYWKDPRTGCCMGSCDTVTEIDDCCQIWTPRHSHDIDDCTTCRSDGGGHRWRGCCACCHEDEGDIDPCSVWKGLVSYSYTHITTGCTSACGGVDDPQVTCAASGGTQSVTLDFSVNKNGIYDPIFDETNCIVLNMGSGETFTRCDGDEHECCEGGIQGCGHYGWWCKKVGDASSIGCNGDCCGEEWCDDYGLWIHRQYGTSTEFVFYLHDACGDGNDFMGVYLKIFCPIQYPSYKNTHQCEVGECTTVPFGNCVFCAYSPFYGASNDTISVDECLLFPDSSQCDT